MLNMKEKMKNEIQKILKNSTIFLTIYIFSIEILFKIVTDTFAWNYSLIRILLSSMIISIIVNGLLIFVKKPNVKKAILISTVSQPMP